MNTYKNKDTNVIILCDSELSGDWELVEQIEEHKSVEGVEEKPQKPTNKRGNSKKE